MPHALLLSPDDQAVSAITGVLEELSVTCERPLDGASAAQMLNSQRFDLVLVDCENLPAAKLIFDVCRRGKGGHNPVSIAIVDGRAGLPTAFRLGAELILTKPVAKDQARTTIRTAVGRVRKDVPVEAAVTPAVARVAEGENVRAVAASAEATPSFLTSYSDPVPQFSSIPTTSSVSHPVGSAQNAASAAPPAHVAPEKMNSAGVDESEVESKRSFSRSKSQPASLSQSSGPQRSLSHAAAAAPSAASSKPEWISTEQDLPVSEDPVMAELERTEHEESEREKAQAPSPKAAKGAPQPAAEKSDAPFFSAYQQNQRTNRRPLLVVLVLTLAVAGFYAAWTYVPAFRAFAEPQVDRVLTLASGVLPPTQNPARPAAQPAKPTLAAPQPTSNVNPVQTPAGDSATSTPRADSSPADSANGANAAPGGATMPASSTGSASAPADGNADNPKTEALKADGSKLNSSASDDGKGGTGKIAGAKTSASRKDEVAQASAEAPLPGEATAVILSSQGAQKRLVHSVPAKYPRGVRSGDAQGTVVLKAVIDEAGRVEGLRVVEGEETLSVAALQAVKQWHYRPYVRNGKTLPFQTIVIVDFQRP